MVFGGICSMQHIHPDEQICFKRKMSFSRRQHFAIQPEQMVRTKFVLCKVIIALLRIGARHLPKQDRLILGFREHHIVNA